MREPWDAYFMRIATAVATRATCPRKHVGAVIVRDRHVLVTGYNGALRGETHCDEVGCLMEDGHCVRAVHAEANALLQAAQHGIAIGPSRVSVIDHGVTLYTTASPCWPCFKLIVNAGITRVVYGEAYRTEDPGPRRVVEVAERAGVELVALDLTYAPEVESPSPWIADGLPAKWREDVHCAFSKAGVDPVATLMQSALRLVATAVINRPPSDTRSACDRHALSETLKEMALRRNCSTR